MNNYIARISATTFISYPLFKYDLFLMFQDILFPPLAIEYYYLNQISLLDLKAHNNYMYVLCHMWGILSQLYRLYIPVLHGRLLAILEQKYMIHIFHQKNLQGAWLSEETAENLLPNSAKQYM